MTKVVTRSKVNLVEAGWFDVLAYKTKEQWTGPEFAEEVDEGFDNLQDAIDCANGPEFSDYFQVAVAAFGRHSDYESGERVFFRFKRAE